MNRPTKSDAEVEIDWLTYGMLMMMGVIIIEGMKPHQTRGKDTHHDDDYDDDDNNNNNLIQKGFRPAGGETAS